MSSFGYFRLVATVLMAAMLDLGHAGSAAAQDACVEDGMNRTIRFGCVRTGGGNCRNQAELDGETRVQEDAGTITLDLWVVGSRTVCPIEVGYETVAGSGTATAGDDYTAVTAGTATIPAGEGSFSADRGAITITIVNDDDFEGDETFQVRLLSASYPDFPSSTEIDIHNELTTATVMIEDDDAPVATITGPDAVDESAGTAQYTVTLSGSPSAAVDVTWAVTNGGTASGATATTAADFTGGTLPTGTLSFTSGTTDLTQTFTVPIADDSANEPDTETFTVTLATGSGAVGIGDPASAQTTITDDYLPAARMREWPGFIIPAPELVEEEVPAPSFGELVRAGFSFNSVINAIDLLSRPSYPPDPDFDFAARAKASPYTLNYGHRFIGVGSDAEWTAVEQRIQTEVDNLQTLEAAGWAGVATGIAAGILDPTILIPIGATAKIGASVARGMLFLGAGETGREAVLLAANETRTSAEAITTIGVATVLGGILGGAVSPRRRRSLKKGKTMKNLVNIVSDIMPIGFLICMIIAWLTHLYVCFTAELWGFLIAGALFFPIGIVHGIGIWFGIW